MTITQNQSYISEIQHFGLPVWVEAETGREYAVALNSDDIYDACVEYCQHYLFDMSANAIAQSMALYDDSTAVGKAGLEEMVNCFIEQKGQESNDTLVDLLGDNIDHFVETNMINFGARYYLAPFDYLERDADDVSEGFISALEGYYELSDSDISNLVFYRIS